MSNLDNDYSDMHKATRTSSLRRRFNTGMTAFLVIATCIVFYFLLLRLSSIVGFIGKLLGVLSPIWFGCAFAYLMNPITKGVENKCMVYLADSTMEEKKKKSLSRTAGVIVSLVVLLAIVIILFNLLIPELYKSIRHLILILPSQINSLMNQIESIDTTSSLGSTLVELTEGVFSSLTGWLRGDLWDNVNTMMGSVTTGIINAISTIINMLIGLVIAVYLMMSKEAFSGGITRLVYAYVKRERANFFMSVAHKCNEIFSGFVIGKLIDSLIIGVLCFIGMSIFHMSSSYTLLISVIVGVTNIIPFFGPFIGAVPSTFLLLLENPVHALYFIIFVLILQQLDGNVIGPKILGSSTGLSAFWVVVAILIGSGLFGFLGMLLGVPTFAVFYYLFEITVEERLKAKGLSVDKEDYVFMKGINEDMTRVYDERTEEEKKQDRDNRWPILAKFRKLMHTEINNAINKNKEPDFDEFFEPEEEEKDKDQEQ